MDERIKQLLLPDEIVIERLKEVSSLSTQTVESLIVEIGLDMSVFPTERHLAS